MTDFQSDFDQATTSINDTVSTQLSSSMSWRSVQGYLVKASASSAGYVWGYNSTSNVYICQLHCSGNCVPVSVPNLLTVLDLTTDGTEVYILGNSTNGTLNLFIAQANNQGTWSEIPVPFSATNIFSTHTYIWAQDGSMNKQKCPKPCMKGNWIPVSENKVKITSSTDSALYGIDSTGSPMTTDETLQSTWKSITGFEKTKLTSIVGGLDSDIYAIDTKSHILRFDGKEPEPIDTAGYTPLTMTVDPSSKEAWLTSSNFGSIGNIFNKLLKSDYTEIMNRINPFDKTRAGVVTEVQKEFEDQTNQLTINKLVNEVVQFFSNHFKQSGDPKTDIDKINKDIQDTQFQINTINFNIPFIRNLILVLLIVVFVYILGSSIGWPIHIVALVVLVAGLYYSITN